MKIQLTTDPYTSRAQSFHFEADEQVFYSVLAFLRLQARERESSTPTLGELFYQQQEAAWLRHQ